MRASLALSLFLAVLALSAEIVQIGNENLVNQSLPIEAATTYSYSQQLYYATEIQYLGHVNSISLQYSVVGNLFAANNTTWQVWLGHTERAFLDGWVPLDSLTLVFDGTLSLDWFSGGLPGQGWLTIPLAEPFFYDSVGNLVLAVDENSPGSSSTGDEFLCSASTPTRGLVYFSMSVNPDPASPPDTGLNFRNSFPNLRLEMTVYSYLPYQPSPADQVSGVATDTDFLWQSDSETFDLYLGDSPQNLVLQAQGLTACQWNPSEPLQMLQTYYWQVIAHHEGQDYPGYVWSFTTAGEGIGPPQNLIAWYSGDHVQLDWSPPLYGNPTLYRVFRNGTFFAVSQTTSYEDFEVGPGQVHYYYVKAENALGEISDPSNTATVHIPEIIPNLILQQGFEACTPFSQSIAGWQNLDLDGAATWSWNGIDFPGEGDPLAWLSFFPSQTVPPLTSIAAHGGAAMAASFSAVVPPSNDWLISPRLNLGTQPQLSFWARSHTVDYGLERLRVLISATDAEPASFTALNAGNWLLVPEEWSQYSYDLSAWQGQSVYLAWNCVSWDALALYLDDIVITGEGGYVSLEEELAPPPVFRVHPNPSEGAFVVSSTAKAPFDLALYDLRGRKLFSARGLSGFSSREHLPDLPSGIYFLKLKGGGKGAGFRLAVIK
ncbi:MAG: T9SS type A sorting domain-containing protein [Candidatus Syntrophosphaera sp.]|nr:T9SS type A sorting domain-containing protein [Candidatus Syntrophosphaera sp.]